MSIRATAVAGLFYPGSSPVLRETVDQLLSTTMTSNVAVKAIIVPHAGYVYSGAVAGAAFGAVRGQKNISRVVIVGPAHRVYFRGMALSSATEFSSPLGLLSVDRDATAKASELPDVVISDAAHKEEHSLEVQLPFLQRCFAQPFRIVPILVGDIAGEAVANLIEHLWGGEETLIVVSTDLSHYLPYAEARRQDALTVSGILARRTDFAGDEACGCRPLNGFLLEARQHDLQLKLMAACNSGDTAGGSDRVVGYASFCAS